MSLVSTEWLEKNLNNVRIIDASWHMPNSKRNAHSEFLKAHIENTVFFDLDKSSDEKSSLPHMMPDKDKWERIVTEQGIKNSDQLIIYDNSDTLVPVGVGSHLFILVMIPTEYQFWMVVL